MRDYDVQYPNALTYRIYVSIFSTPMKTRLMPPVLYRRVDTGISLTMKGSFTQVAYVF